MRIGPIVLLCWALVFLASLVGVAISLRRHGSRGLGFALLCPAGAALMLGLWVAAAGVLEGAWGWTTTGLWIAIPLGAVGVLLQVVGWRAAWRPRRRAGECAVCGYDRGGLGAGVCPECGKE